MSSKNTKAFNIAEKYELSENHKRIVDAILDRDNKLIFIDGPAGTAKTYCAVLAALKLIQRKKELIDVLTIDFNYCCPFLL